MRTADQWKEYRIIDTSGKEKLEFWGKYILSRPDPQIIWDTPKEPSLWGKADAHYIRSPKGGGSWEFYKKLPEFWQLHYKELTFKISPTGFKHTGLFPEQAANWELLQSIIHSCGRPVRALNLFAYTGGATLAMAAAGAEVCHVDASKGMVAWGKENAAFSGLSGKPIRWIVDDCEKFVQREIRRGSRYDIIVMDPPSYGRGPGGEVWQLEEKIYHLLTLCEQVLSEKPLLFLLNSYTTGLSPSVMSYLLGTTILQKHRGTVEADEIGLPVQKSGFILPCGSTAIFRGE